MSNTLATITPHGWILALFIRDDGERLLLGDGYYEFKEEQRHFVANTYINDVVELQGTDGQLIAGQVRRSQAQPFDGYVCDPTIDQATTEQKRRDFFLFFRKNHEYKVVYIFPNGEAIQRTGGYIVDAPEIREIIQRSPEYHVALAFEDVNYYTYAEAPDGSEKYTYEAELTPVFATDGGLVFDANGMTSDSFVYTGKNLFNPQGVNRLDGYFVSGGGYISANINYITLVMPCEESTTYTLSFAQTTNPRCRIGTSNTRIKQTTTGMTILEDTPTGYVSPLTFTTPSGAKWLALDLYNKNSPEPFDDFIKTIQLEKGSTPTTYQAYDPTKTTGGLIWEASSSGTPITVNIQGVDKAYPVLEITGPAVDPVLTNITTGEEFFWTGTVPLGQTLRVDMREMTATMNGANVFEFVSGSWVGFEPGPNTVRYTAASATYPAKIYYNEVVG